MRLKGIMKEVEVNNKEVGNTAIVSQPLYYDFILLNTVFAFV